MISIEARLNILLEFISLIEIILDIPTSREWFRSIDLWVMGPARFRCATLPYSYKLEMHHLNPSSMHIVIYYGKQL